MKELRERGEILVIAEKQAELEIMCPIQMNQYKHSLNSLVSIWAHVEKFVVL